MIKYIFDGSKTVVESSGDAVGICIDIAHIVNSVYSAIKSNDPLDADRFRELFIEAFSDRSSPIWQSSKQMNGIVIHTPGRKREER